MRMLGRVSSLFLALSVLGSVSAQAEEAACRTFKWNLDRELSWFQATPPALASGAELSTDEGAAAIQLSPAERLTFAVAPGHKPAPETFGAVVSLPPLEKAGIYQVTLSDEGWIDAIQAGVAVKSGAFSGQKGCSGLRKSVRFDLKPGPVTFQISGVKAQTINLAVAPGE
jgi:hypothetical protein